MPIHEQPHHRSILELCLNDISEVEKCFDIESGKCKDKQLAQELLVKLKARWKSRDRELWNSPYGLSLLKARCRIKARANSRPVASWLCELDDARSEIEHSLGNHPA